MGPKGAKEAHGGRQKERGRHKAGPSPIQLLYSNYPLVTTGGGALPLPTSAQPAMLRRANTAAVAITSFFMENTPPCHDTLNHTEGAIRPLVLKRHSLDLIASRLGSKPVAS